MPSNVATPFAIGDGFVAVEGRQIAAIHDLCGQLAAATDLDARLRAILAASMQAVDGTAGCILLYRASDDQLVVKDALGLGDAMLVGNSMSASSGIVGTAFRSKVAHVSNRPSGGRNGHGDAHEVAASGTRAVVTVPITCTEYRAVGVMQVFDKQHGGFTTEDLRVLEIIASIAVTAIETTQVHRNLQLAGIARAVGDLSHDLRNKLTPILLSADTLGPILDVMFRDLDEIGRHASPDTAADMRQALTYASAFYKEALQIIRHQVGSTLTYTGMIANAIKGVISEPEIALHDVAATLRTPILELHSLAIHAGVRLLSDFEPMGECPFDPLLIERAVYNLVSNAIAETAAGGRITVRARRHEGGDFPVGNCLLIEVQDTGRGMPASVLDAILQGEASSTKPGGTGLGTRIARNAVAAHHGLFEGESVQGAGSTFRLRLPLTTQAGR